jgi:hypothetical protein
VFGDRHCGARREGGEGRWKSDVDLQLLCINSSLVGDEEVPIYSWVELH